MAEGGQSSDSTDWIACIRKKIRDLPDRRPLSYILKVPNSHRKLDDRDDACSPRIVSIGLLHSSTTQTSGKKDHPLDMELHKVWYINYLLNRMTNQATPKNQNTNEIWESWREVILNNIEHVRASYAEEISSQFKSEELCTIMLVDGCFILELFLRSTVDEVLGKEDPIFNTVWMVPTLRHDLALTENQIPFKILKELFRIVKEKIIESLPSITFLALSFFCPDLYLDQREIEQTLPENGVGVPLHLLDLLHKFYLFKDENTISEHCLTVISNPAPDHHVIRGSTKNFHSKGKSFQGFTKSATELFDAGIEFKVGKDDHPTNISFKSGVLTIPPLRIDETTKSLLRNLIAFEQCLGEKEQRIQSYVILVGSLIHSSEDIILLQREGIIINNLGGVQEVSTFISDIRLGVAARDFCFVTLCEDVDAYLSWWRKYRAEWKRFCIQNPWGIITIALLILTMLSTVYVVITYYPHPSLITALFN